VNEAERESVVVWIPCRRSGVSGEDTREKRVREIGDIRERSARWHSRGALRRGGRQS